MNVAYSMLVYIVWFFSTYFTMVLILTLLLHKESLFISPENKGEKLPKVSIIISAYNEEKDIGATIESLKQVDYPKELIEIIVVNDGSKDNTSNILKPYAERKEVIFIDNAGNKGKAACLNQGIAEAAGEFVACMDADTVADKDVLMKTIPYFRDKKIGAVTVPVEVKNPKTLLEKVIELEYILGLSLFLKVLSMFDTVLVTPGPFSIYRKTMLKEIGSFDPTNITEDLEIAYRIHKAKYKIACCLNTKVTTIIPDTFKGLYHQRKRWYSGALLTVMQHKKMLFKKDYGLFGYFVPFNYTIILLGLALFLYSLYLFFSNIFKALSYFYLTNFNIWSHLMALKAFDPLLFSIFGFLGIASISMTIIALVIGLVYTNKSIKGRYLSSIGFVLLFFLYQVFWFSSVYAVVARKKIRW
ncbi:glycosyltransferase family 2 protein [Candidatus Woesearchaeota archaeon]|nr:glycosyltransferase family 2 protein [Candidatus Woesearchaeota archaeon]